MFKCNIIWIIYEIFPFLSHASVRTFVIDFEEFLRYNVIFPVAVFPDFEAEHEVNV